MWTQALCQEDYFVYHSIINRAEEKIGEEDFSTALTIYDSVFTQFEYVFAKDYVIAAQLAAFLDDRSRCMDYMVKAMYGGYKEYCFEQLYQIRRVLNDIDWKEIKRKEFLCRDKYRSSVNWPLNIEISKRHRKMDEINDRKWRNQALCENYDFLLSAHDFFPSARRIGIDDQNLDPLLVSTRGWKLLQDCEACNSKVIYTLTQVEDPIRDFGTEYFMNAVRSGDLRPIELSWIYGHDSTNVDCHPESDLIENIPDLWFCCNPGDPDYNIDRINENRKSIGLGTYETEMKLFKMEMKYSIKLRFGVW